MSICEYIIAVVLIHRSSTGASPDGDGCECFLRNRKKVIPGDIH